MGHLTRRTVLLLFLSVVLLSVIIRYPLVEHERYQTDSYYIHNLADAIVVDGYACWTYHPLSYVGYYPLSYPSGVPFVLAEVSSLTGISVEASILLMNWAIALLFCSSVFLLARLFISRTEFALLAALFAILGPRFVDTSYWDASARAPAIAILTLIVIVFLNAERLGRLRPMVIGALLAIGCFAMHHMAVLLIVFGIAYVITVIEAEYVFKRLRHRGRTVVVAVGIVTSILIIVTPFLLFDYFWDSVLRAFKESLIEGVDSKFLNVILRAASSYTNQIGFAIFFAAAYIPIAVRRSRLTTRNTFPLFVIIAFMPLVGEALYVSMILAPFVAVIAAMWFADAFRKPGRKIMVSVLLSVLLASSIILPLWSTNRWNSQTLIAGDTLVVDNQVFNDAFYMMYNAGDVFAVSNVHSVEARLDALSRVGFLGPGVSLALNGDVSAEEVHQGIEESSREFPKNIYSWYEYDMEPPVRTYIRNLMTLGVSYIRTPIGLGYAADYFSSHSRLMVVIDNDWSSKYVTTSSVQEAQLPGELYASNTLTSYQYYSSETISAFYVQLPSIGY